jgi:hypothetical protein
MAKKNNNQKPPEPSILLIEEYFEAEDDRFLEELLPSVAEKRLQNFATRWYQAKTPFAREMLLRYIDDGCDRPHHRPMVKRLFKLAEAAADDEAMSRFMVAFDRLSKRVLVQTKDWRGNVHRHLAPAEPGIPMRFSYSRQKPKSFFPAPRFSRVTRLYLQRRAFRYFRKIGRADPERYGRVIRGALLRYQDQHLQKPENLLDAWSLMHILYWGSPVLLRNARGIRVAKDRSMAQLGPAPYCLQAWGKRFPEILELFEQAQSRTVRMYCQKLLLRDYAEELVRLPLSRILHLVGAAYEEVQNLGVEVLRGAKGLETLAVEDWLTLLKIENLFALPVLCDLAVKHIKPDQLSLAQAITLARTKFAPVAELGLLWLLEKRAESEEDLLRMLSLANAEVPGVRQQAIDFVLQELTASHLFKPEHLRELLDSKYADVRERALALMWTEPKTRESVVLWGALSESPYDDVRAQLLGRLKEFEPRFSPDTLRAVWATALLNIHRGGRAKRLVVNQVANRILSSPPEAGALVPLLGIALRSVRAPERRGALAALARAALRRPELRALLGQKLPELKLLDEEAA